MKDGNNSFFCYNIREQDFTSDLYTLIMAILSTIRLFNGKVKTMIMMIITIVCIFLLFLTSVYTQDVMPKLKPSCDHLEITPCIKRYNKDEHGKFDFRYYIEECSFHTCTTISPPKPPPPLPYTGVHWIPPPQSVTQAFEEEDFLKDKMTTYMNKMSRSPPQFQFSQFRSHNESYLSQDTYLQQQPLIKPSVKKTTDITSHQNISRYWDPTLIGMDNEGRFVRAATEPWFCSGYGPPKTGSFYAGVDYDARVATNTQRSLGQTEDLKAHCEFLRFMDLIFMSSCDFLPQGCDPCLYAYRAFMCALHFPRCRPAPGNIYGTGRNLANNQTDKIIYVPNNLPKDVNLNASYTIIKPCRGLCFDVQTGCPMSTQVQCHLKESRDFADAPDCNSVNSVTGSQVVY